MKVNKVPKIHYATIRDEYRPIMDYILLTKDEIVATDGHILVVHQTKNIFEDFFIDQLPKRCLISSENWKILCKGYHSIEYVKKSKCIKIYSKLNNIFLVNVEFEKDIEKDWLNYKAVFDSYERGDIDSIGISPRFLYNLAIAMDSPDTAELNFHAKNKGILIKSKNSKGLIMPRIIDFE